MNIIKKFAAKLTDYKRKKRFWAFAALVLVLIGGVGYWLQKQADKPSVQPQELEAKVERGDIIVGLESDGTIDFSKVKLRFDVRGTIAEILVEEGDKVNKGDIIAKLDDKDYQDQYQLALAKLEEAQDQEVTSLLDLELNLKKAEAELENLRAEYQEMEAIPDAYSANEIKLKKLELDNKETEYQNLQKKYQLQKDRGIDQNELAVKMAKEDLEDTILYAPVTGVVLDLAKKVGESLTDEDDFATIHENNVIKATTNVIEYDIGQIKEGQKVYVTAEAIPDKEFTGTVTNIDALPVSDSSGLVNYAVEITIEDADDRIKDGMTCTVNFIIKEVQDCLIIPYQAVKIVNGKQVVTVVDEQGQKTEKEIKTGFTDGTSAEVLSGLRANETVIYTGSR